MTAHLFLALLQSEGPFACTCSRVAQPIKSIFKKRDPIDNITYEYMVRQLNKPVIARGPQIMYLYLFVKLVHFT
jgi:hypothetical protein